MQHTEIGVPALHSALDQAARGVSFDTERLIIIGKYSDEIAAYRAKRAWGAALEQSFILDSGHDFRIRVGRSEDTECYELRCEFTTACGRYAFWRLTHNQAPETQFLIEHAHVPTPGRSTYSYSAMTDSDDPTAFIESYSMPRERREWRRYIKGFFDRLFRR